MKRLRTAIAVLVALVAIPSVAFAPINLDDQVYALIEENDPTLLPSLDTSQTIGPTTVLVNDPASGSSKLQLTTVTLTKRMSILYATDASVRQILGGSAETAALPWLFRQEPSNSGAGAALTGGGAQRMRKVSGAALAKMTSDAMTGALTAAIETECRTPAGVSTCGAHMVAVDEIGVAFGVPPGTALTSASPASKLLSAMKRLALRPFPGGGSYAGRVHFYLAPGVSTAISAGMGPSRTLGRDGEEHWHNYTTAMQALGLAGGVWLEMYHYPTPGSPRTPFTSGEWRDVPTDVAALMKSVSGSGANRNPLERMHFVMTETQGNDVLPGPLCMIFHISSHVIFPITDLAGCYTKPVCVSSRASVPNPSSLQAQVLLSQLADASLQSLPATGAPFPISQPTPSGMACQWQRAQTGSVNQRILMNGPAAYRVTGTEAIVFGTLFRQFFIVS